MAAVESETTGLVARPEVLEIGEGWYEEAEPDVSKEDPDAEDFKYAQAY